MERYGSYSPISHGVRRRRRAWISHFSQSGKRWRHRRTLFLRLMVLGHRQRIVTANPIEHAHGWRIPRCAGGRPRVQYTLLKILHGAVHSDAQVPYHWIATSENAPHINFIVGTRRPAPRSSSTNIIEFLKEQQNFTNLGVTTLKSVPRIGPLRTGKKQVRMVDFEYDNQPVAFETILVPRDRDVPDVHAREIFWHRRRTVSSSNHIRNILVVRGKPRDRCEWLKKRDTHRTREARSLLQVVGNRWRDAVVDTYKRPAERVLE